MPLFALANAGVNVRDVNLDAPDSTRLLPGIVAGLAIGKPVGIVLASVAAIRLGVATAPAGVTWKGITLVVCVAEIGFTMAIFVAGLAFPDAGHLSHNPAIDEVPDGGDDGRGAAGWIWTHDKPRGARSTSGAARLAKGAIQWQGRP
jgi:hypothetical protein